MTTNNNQVIGEGTRLLSAVLRDQSHTVFRQIRREWLLDREPDLFDFITNHSRRYGNIPSLETARQNGFMVIEVPESSGYYLNQTADRAAYNQAIAIHTQITQALQARDMERVSRLYQQAVRSVGTQRIHQETVTIQQVGRQVLEQLHANQWTAGPSGVMTGYAPIDDDLLGLKPGELLIIAGRPKAQPLHSKVLLSNGTFTRMGDIKVGDSIASVDGGESFVESIHPQGFKNVYEITFNDGRIVECCEDHLWEVGYYGWDKSKVLSTKDLIDKLGSSQFKNRLHVPLQSGDFGVKKELPLDPWLLGVLLGDGGLTRSDTHSVTFSNSEDDIIDRASKLIANIGGELKLVFNKKVNVQCEHYVSRTNISLREPLRQLGLNGLNSKEKFIPEIYFSCDKHQRLELLRGLIDTDGTVNTKDGRIKIGFTNERLAKDAQRLVWSLGGLAKIKNWKTASGNTHYEMGVRFNNVTPFSSVKHKSRYDKYLSIGREIKVQRNTILSITKKYRAECQCIRVTHDRHLYLTDGYITTHNTGKTYYMLQMVISAWLSGNSVLFVSMEMSPQGLVNRIAAMIARINPRVLRSNDISSFSYERIADTIRGFDDLPPFHFVAGNFRKTPAEITRYAQDLSPDLIGVDGAYLLSANDRTFKSAKHEELAAVIGDLKAMGEDTGIPQIDTVQFNRAAANTARSNRRANVNVDMDIEHLAGTDAFGQTATAVLGLSKVRGRDDARRMRMLVTRDAEGNADMLLNCRFNPPDFSYISDYVEEDIHAGVNGLDQETRQALA